MTQTHKLAIYDMDRTITIRPTYTPFLIHAALRLAPWRLLLVPLLTPAFIAYGLKLIDRKRLKEIMQHMVLGAHSCPQELARVSSSFAAKTMVHNVYREALGTIARDRAEGYRLVLATASYRLYAKHIAEALGFDEVIATNHFIGLDARVHARVEGDNCYGPAKLRMILAWMHGKGMSRADAHVRFYSDHASDAPVLEWSDEPYAVNAHDRLRSLAVERGWAIVDWAR